MDKCHEDLCSAGRKADSKGRFLLTQKQGLIASKNQEPALKAKGYYFGYYEQCKKLSNNVVLVVPAVATTTVTFALRMWRE